MAQHVTQGHIMPNTSSASTPISTSASSSSSTSASSLSTYNMHPSSSTSSSSNTNMAIEAGRAIGPFCIGMDIGAALAIASQYEENPDVIVDRLDPFIHDTLLDLPNLGFRLCFDGYSQRLHVIAVNLQPSTSSSSSSTPKTPNDSQHSPRLSSSSSSTTTHHHLLRSVLTFSFNSVPLIRSARSPPPDLRYVYRVCGPTIPGHYQIQQQQHSTSDPLSNNPQVEAHSPDPSHPTASQPPSVSYYLKYPGLAFRFPIPYEDYESLKSSSDEDLLPFILPVSDSKGFSAPILEQLFLFPPDSPLTDTQNPPWLSPSPIPPAVAASSLNDGPYSSCPPSVGPRASVGSSVVVRTSDEDPTSLPTTPVEDPTPPLDDESVVPLSLIPKQRHWNIEVILREGVRFPWGGSIYFGASLQDVYAEIGAPDRVTLKDIDVVGIMSSHADLKSYLTNTDGEVTSQSLGLTNGASLHPQALPSPDYFCNYFYKGFDLLVCSVTHRVKKIVLHTNLPGHIQFGDYVRCFFSIALKSSFVAALDVDSRWDEIERYLGKASPPLLVDGPSASRGDAIGGLTTVRKFYGYPGMAIEVFDKKWIASVSLF